MQRASVDIHPHRQFAAMTALLIGVIAAVWLHLATSASQGDVVLRAHGAVPHKILTLLHWRQPYRAIPAVQSILTSLLLHANWAVLTANIFMLLLFGPSVEDRISHYRFALLFALCGSIAVIAQCLAVPDSRTAFVGAQGGVAGIAGACLAISPRGHVPTMIRGLEFPWLFGPALWLLVSILLSVSPLPTPGGVESVGLPYQLLAFAAGVALGEFYRRHRPILLRG